MLFKLLVKCVELLYFRRSDTCAGAGFVKKIYRLVREKSVVDLTFRKHCTLSEHIV